MLIHYYPDVYAIVEVAISSHGSNLVKMLLMTASLRANLGQACLVALHHRAYTQYRVST